MAVIQRAQLPLLKNGLFLAPLVLCSTLPSCVSVRKMGHKVNKYPSTMDMGEAFYSRCFDPVDVKKRRAENTKVFPPREQLNAIMPPMSAAEGYRMKFYWDGVYGNLPELPVDFDLLERKFFDEADPDTIAWLYGRAGSKATYHNSRSDFENWRIVPRMLTGVTDCDTAMKFTMRGKEFMFKGPVGFAPVGVQGRVTYPSTEADLHTSRAAAKHNLLFTLSHVSSQPLERVIADMKEVNPEAPAPWYQLYNNTVPEVSESILRRARKAGYGAIVLTVDTGMYGYRTEELDAAYLPQADTRVDWGQPRFDPVFNAILKQKFNCVADESFSENGKYQVNRLVTNMTLMQLHGGSLGETWDRIPSEEGKPPRRRNDNADWLIELCNGELDLPLVLKGVLHPGDAVKAVEKGFDAVWVTTHGGRQCDGSISSIEALPGIVKAVRETCQRLNKPEIPILIDGGVRYGQHALKAYALGASGIMLGRPPVIGLALGGQSGVEHIVLTMMEDIRCTAVNAGIGNIREIAKDVIVRAPNVGPPPFTQ
eukprot:comp23905_c0_seq1/m.42088 comp23905_c0_seq1/g.42088  ORF comp23905_c0_seq1/g.42088 comp23905_c0_seq1/m.42088 type:complete len:538 (-) comp23905_c0_seq1:356-1969(-)